MARGCRRAPPGGGHGRPSAKRRGQMAPQPSTVVSPLTPPHRVTEPIHLTASTRPHTAESNPTRPQTVRRLHAPHSRRSSGHPPTQVTAVRNQMGMARSKMAYSWHVGSPSTGRWPLRAARTCRDIAATSLILACEQRVTKLRHVGTVCGLSDQSTEMKIRAGNGPDMSRVLSIHSQCA